METNEFEQLCINFANETLQQVFNQHVLAAEQSCYLEEGILFSPVKIPSNQACLDLISSKPSGIFTLLSEQTRLGRKVTDESFLATVDKAHLQPMSSKRTASKSQAAGKIVVTATSVWVLLMPLLFACQFIRSQGKENRINL